MYLLRLEQPFLDGSMVRPRGIKSVEELFLDVTVVVVGIYIGYILIDKHSFFYKSFIDSSPSLGVRELLIATIFLMVYVILMLFLLFCAWNWYRSLINHLKNINWFWKCAGWFILLIGPMVINNSLKYGLVCSSHDLVKVCFVGVLAITWLILFELIVFNVFYKK